MTYNFVERLIEETLRSLNPSHCAIRNFSDQHSRGENSHFAIVLVSSDFCSMNRLQRQQSVNRALQPLLHHPTHPIHAWTLELYSPQEWQQLSQAHETREIPACRGGDQVGAK